ncbi:hypothetical protein J2X15_001508 [Rhodoferax saidenbachensis]|uniref:Uncharacterized protein n=1 Tax=Rhodoferax saidenbachensis TaxID=1484693 RepID=A0ABU1ZL04_9BURK|nr:hypothetical protein [Rhodoferax saidenbachensis]
MTIAMLLVNAMEAAEKSNGPIRHRNSPPHLRTRSQSLGPVAPDPLYRVLADAMA